MVKALAEAQLQSTAAMRDLVANNQRNQQNASMHNSTNDKLPRIFEQKFTALEVENYPLTLDTVTWEQDLRKFFDYVGPAHNAIMKVTTLDDAQYQQLCMSSSEQAMMLRAGCGDQKKRRRRRGRGIITKKKNK